jgi:hypothetical protein
MDANQFRKPTMPDLRAKVNGQKTENIAVAREMPPIVTGPVEDPRFGGYGAVMADGRLITDYRTHCEYNYSPSKYGESVRLWLQRNAEGVIQVTRDRQAKRVGAQYRKAPTVPPFQQTNKCNEFQCGFDYNPDRRAIGLGRIEGCPELFGTWGEPLREMPAPTHVGVTTTFEGGRNTPRGRTFQKLGDRSFTTEGVSG